LEDIRKSLMSNTQDEIKDIVAQLQRLQIRETELLERLERLNEGNNNSTDTPVGPRELAIGDVVQIRNPRPFQAREGRIVRIGVDTDRITVQAKNGAKIIRASTNIILIE
jgi:hypothetical protein